MTIDLEKVVGKPPQGLDEIPQQEMFLEVYVNTKDAKLPRGKMTTQTMRRKIYLDEIASMSNSSLIGFKGFVFSQVAALTASSEAYWKDLLRSESSAPDQAGYRKLLFKKKIHSLFKHEIDREIFFRRELYLKNSATIDDAKWLKKFSIPNDEDAFSCLYEQGLKISGGIYEILKRTKAELGEEKYRQLLGKSLPKWFSEEQVNSKAFLLYISKSKGDKIIKFIMEEPVEHT
jgi:hypothetical protein